MPVSMQHSVNVLPRLDGDKPFYKNMEKYIAAQISCLWDYHVKHDLAQVSQNASQHLTEWAGERIIERATNKDPEAIIDMAIRCDLLSPPLLRTRMLTSAFLDTSAGAAQCDRAPKARSTSSTRS